MHHVGGGFELGEREHAARVARDAAKGKGATGDSLSRHGESDALDKLDELPHAWEIRGSDLLESHLSYPMLVYYRSQHDNQSWLAAVIAIMDCCALILVRVEDMQPLQARMTFAMTHQVIVEMARSFGIRPSRYTGSDRLSHADYARMISILQQAPVLWIYATNAEEVLASLRACRNDVWPMKLRDNRRQSMLITAMGMPIGDRFVAMSHHVCLPDQPH